MNRSRKALVSLLILASLLFSVGCTSKAAKAIEKVELGQKYLTELNYTEAIASFTEAINLDPENIPAYMGRAQAYRATEQYAEAKADYTTVIEKTAEQPYTQATALVGRAEVSELTRDDQDALTDYQSASKVLETVEVEKLTDVTEQMLEALKIKVYEACARLSAFFGQHEAAIASYTNALDSLEKLPDDAEVLNVPAEKITSYAGRAESRLVLEQYEALVPDYDALIALGEDKTEERDALLSALSLAKSKAADLNAPESWLEEVNHSDYAQSMELDQMNDTLAQVSALAAEKGVDAYSDIKKALESEGAQQAMRKLLARGYQLRSYDADGRMLAVYVGDTAWPDVHEEENGQLDASSLEQAMIVPTEEEVNAVSLKNLYVYYGTAVGRSREGEGIWYILNPGTTDVKAKSYTWENDRPKSGFEQQTNRGSLENDRPISHVERQTNWDTFTYTETFEHEAGTAQRVTTVTYAIGETKVTVQEKWTSDCLKCQDKYPIYYTATVTLSEPIQSISRDGYGAIFSIPGETLIEANQKSVYADGTTTENNIMVGSNWGSYKHIFSYSKDIQLPYRIRSTETVSILYSDYLDSYSIYFEGK